MDGSFSKTKYLDFTFRKKTIIILKILSEDIHRLMNDMSDYI